MANEGVYWQMVHAGLYRADVCGEGYFIVRRRGSWWLMYDRDYRNTADSDIGAGNAKEFKTLVRVKAHLKALDWITRLMKEGDPFE